VTYCLGDIRPEGIISHKRPGNKTNSLVNCFLSVSGNKAN